MSVGGQFHRLPPLAQAGEVPRTPSNFIPLASAPATTRSASAKYHSPGAGSRSAQAKSQRSQPAPAPAMASSSASTVAAPKNLMWLEAAPKISPTVPGAGTASTSAVPGCAMSAGGESGGGEGQHGEQA